MLQCWGKNTKGSLGVGNVFDLGDDEYELGDALPFVELGVPAVALDGGDDHTCALLSDRSVKVRAEGRILVQYMRLCWSIISLWVMRPCVAASVAASVPASVSESVSVSVSASVFCLCFCACSCFVPVPVLCPFFCLLLFPFQF